MTKFAERLNDFNTKPEVKAATISAFIGVAGSILVMEFSNFRNTLFFLFAVAPATGILLQGLIRKESKVLLLTASIAASIFTLGMNFLMGSGLILMFPEGVPQAVVNVFNYVVFGVLFFGVYKSYSIFITKIRVSE